MDEPTEITVTASLPQPEPTAEATPTVAVVTTPAATDSTLAMEVGELRARVDALTTENETLRQRVESAQVTADMAFRETTTEPEPVAIVEEVATTEPEPEPASVDADGQKAPATGGRLKELLHSILF